MIALSALPAAVPVRNSEVVVSDGGGGNALVSDLLSLIALTDLPAGGALPGQVLVWNGAAWAPANVLGVLVSLLPTSPSGLATGTLWNNGGLMAIAP